MIHDYLVGALADDYRKLWYYPIVEWDYPIKQAVHFPSRMMGMDGFMEEETMKKMETWVI